MGIIVVADTHLGIRKCGINASMPGYFADFLEWVKTINEKDGFKVKIVDGSINEGNIRERTIYPPNKLVLLGDMIEFWESENEPVAACVSTVIPTLSEIAAEKIYVLGNHDNILKNTVLEKPKGTYMYYHLGKSLLTIFPDVYPPQTGDTLVTEKCGNENYLFVHGHQFDKYFRETGGSYKIWAIVRDASDNLTLYVPFLFFVSLAFKIINCVAHTSFFLGENPTLGLLFLLTIPRIYMNCGRRIWDRIVGMKYKKQQTIDSFTKWWKKTITSKKLPQNINVVYGHTHYLNYLDPEIVYEEEFSRTLHKFYTGKLEEREIKEEKRPVLANISAWVTDFPDFTEKCFRNMENVSFRMKRLFFKIRKDRINPELETVATFLYIDEDGPEFFGWNWYSKNGHRIFHIPKAAIIRRREVGPVTDDDLIRKVLEKIGWPQEVIQLWKKDPHLQ